MRHKYNSVVTKYISKLLVKFSELNTFQLEKWTSLATSTLVVEVEVETKVQHLMSVSNFLVVNIHTKNVSIKQTAINEVQKKKKKLKQSL